MRDLFSHRPGVRARLIFCLISLGFLGACQGAKPDETAALRQDAEAFSRLAQINSLMGAGRTITPEQFSALKAIREKYPNVPEVRQIYINALIIREDWDILERTLNETPLAEQTIADRRMLGKVYVRTGKYDQAIEVLRPLADSDPKHIETRSLLAVSLLHSDRLDEAAAQLDSVWERIVADRLVEEITTRGLIYMGQANVSKAIETLKKAVEIDPENARTTNALSQAYARSGDPANAEFYRVKTAEINDRTSAEMLRASRRVQQFYGIETAWNERDFRKVIDLARQALPLTDDKGQKIVLYQYLFESHKALGAEGEAMNALAEARKLQQQK